MFWRKRSEPITLQVEAPPPPPQPPAPEPEPPSEPERELTPDEHAERLNVVIDLFMKHFCGYEDPAERTDESGKRHFQRGSASGAAWVQVDGEGDERVCHFHCAAHVMALPSDRELLLPLYRELLELNWDLVGVARVAVRMNDILVLYSERATEIHSGLQVASAIDMVMGLADALDDRLLGKYTGTSVKV